MLVKVATGRGSHRRRLRFRNTCRWLYRSMFNHNYVVSKQFLSLPPMISVLYSLTTAVQTYHTRFSSTQPSSIIMLREVKSQENKSVVERVECGHYGDIIMGTMAAQITSFSIICLTVYSGTDQRKHQSPASLAFVKGIRRRPANPPHKGPVTRKMFPFDDVIMSEKCPLSISHRLSTRVNLLIDKRILDILPHVIYVSYEANSFSVNKTHSSDLFIYCNGGTILEETPIPGESEIKFLGSYSIAKYPVSIFQFQASSKIPIDLFHNIFPLADSSPNSLNQLMS